MDTKEQAERHRIQQIANANIRLTFSLLFQGKIKDALANHRFGKQIVHERLIALEESLQHH